MIVYLHGFRSSPSSFKARLMQEHMQSAGRLAEWICPQLPASPALAIKMVEALVADYKKDDLVIIGSSLGGFYATYLSEKWACKAVLINPATQPPRDLTPYIGVMKAYHSDDIFEFKASYVDELRALSVEKITKPERYFLLAATGDEVLDWRDMVAHYPQAKHLIIQGSDHGVSDFASYLPAVMDFCDGAA